MNTEYRTLLETLDAEIKVQVFSQKGNPVSHRTVGQIREIAEDMARLGAKFLAELSPGFWVEVEP